MAIQSEVFSTDFNVRTFASTKYIATKQHMAIWLKRVSDETWTQLSINEFELINNSAVLIDAPSSSVYSIIEIRVADEPNELGSSQSDITIVASLESQIQEIVDTVIPNINEILLADDNAVIATTKALEALTSANNADTSEANALTYSNNALTSANNADISEANALSYKNSAEASATTATTQAGIATTKASEASTSATNALASEVQAGVYAGMIAISVGTIENMTAISLPQEGQVVVVRDANRGGVFIYRTTGVANGGTIFDSSSTGKWTRQYSGSVDVKWFGAKGDGVIGDRQPIQNAINFLVNNGGGGEIKVPKGIYLIDSVVSPDTIRNGLLLPSTSEFSTNNSIRLIGEGNESILIAKDNDMCIIRNARPYSDISNIKIDGNSRTNVIGIGLLAEDIASTTILTSNSYFKMSNSYIENCTTGMRFKVGATVSGSDSGCFYHNIDNVIFNSNIEHLKLEKDSTGHNRVTRSLFNNCVFTRGNSGVNILGGTELAFVNCVYELINGTAFYYGDTNPANISIFGGYAEACTKGIVALTASAPYITLYGYQESIAHDTSYAFMNRSNNDGLNISRIPGSSVKLSFGDSFFTSIVADILGNDTKNLSFLNNGIETFRTTENNSLLIGTTISDGYNSKLQVKGYISHEGSQISLTSNSATYEIVNRGNIAKEFQWYVGANGSAPIAKLTTAGTWTNASDIRLKKDVVDIKYGLDTVLKLSPKSYKLKHDNSNGIGFIAQDIKEIIPELVCGKNEDILTLDYASMVSVLVKAIQEQQQQINQLKGQQNVN